MATIRQSILGFATVPDNAGEVFFESYTIKATNDVFPQLVLVFNDTTSRKGVRGSFNVPANYVGNAKIIVVWTSAATSGDVEWDFDYRAVGGNDAESLDQATVQESVNQGDTAPTSTDLRLEAQLALTSANFAVNDTVAFELFRDGSDAGDTMAAAATVHDVLFEYTDV